MKVDIRERRVMSFTQFMVGEIDWLTLPLAPPSEWRPNCFTEAGKTAKGCVGEYMFFAEGDTYTKNEDGSWKKQMLSECVVCPYRDKEYKEE